MATHRRVAARVAFASCIVSMLLPSGAPFTAQVRVGVVLQRRGSVWSTRRREQPCRAHLPLHLSTWNGKDDGGGGGTNDDLDPALPPRRKKRQHPSRRKRSRQRQEEAAQRRSVETGGSAAEPPTAPAEEEEDGPFFPDPRFREDALEGAIDSFLRGEYDRPFADDAPAPHPGLGPSETVDAALRSLRSLDAPEPSHGAAVFLRFCAPLSRGDRWGGGPTTDPWKEVLRGAITPTMLARRIRASPFSALLDWERLDITEGLFVPSTRQELGVGTTIAFVSAAMFFGDGVEPSIVQFTLRKIGGVWLIDTAVISKKEWFVGDKAS